MCIVSTSVSELTVKYVTAMMIIHDFLLMATVIEICFVLVSRIIRDGHVV